MTPISPRPCGGDRRSRAGLDDADDRQRQLGAQGTERVGRRGVARDHDGFDVLIGQKRSDLAAVAAHGVGTLRPVRHARRVAEIHDALVGKLANQLVNDGESADTRVEDADRTGARHQR